MKWNQLEGQWKQMAGQIKSQWGKLTDDDLKVIAGKKEQFVGKLQQHYGVEKSDAEKQIDAWLAKLTPGKAAGRPKPPSANGGRRAQ